MKKFDLSFNVIWVLPTSLLLAIIIGFSFDYKLGILFGLLQFFNDLRFNMVKDEIESLNKIIVELEIKNQDNDE